MSRVTHWILLCVCGCLLSASVQAADIVLVLSNESGAYRDMQQSFVRHLDQIKGNVSLSVITANEASSIAAMPVEQKPRLIISAGTLAARVLASQAIDVPVMCALIPSRAYRKLVRDMTANKRALFSGWFIDQPIQRYLGLIQAALPGNKAVGVLVGENSHYEDGHLIRQAQQLGLELSLRTPNDSLNLTQVTHGLLEDVQVFLALPDPEVINSKTIQSLLMTSYVKRVPMVTYSSSYVSAGALLAVYSLPEQIGQQLAEEVAAINFTENWTLNSENYPRYYKISINQRVAKSLGFYLADEETILNRIKELEKTP